MKGQQHQRKNLFVAARVCRGIPGLAFWLQVEIKKCSHPCSPALLSFPPIRSYTDVLHSARHNFFLSLPPLSLSVVALFLLPLPTSPPTSLLLPIRRLGSAIYKRIPAAETAVSQSFYSFGVCPRLNTTEINALLCRRRAPKDERPHKMATVGRRYAV